MSTITYCETCGKAKYVSWVECGIGETLVDTPQEWCACPIGSGVSLNLISPPEPFTINTSYGYTDATVYFPLSPASLEQIRQVVREELERFSKKWTEG